MICGYKHCKHKDIELDKQNGIKVGKRYWHKECFDESGVIHDIISLFQEKCNSNVVIPALRKVINTIVYDKDTDAKFLLFGVKYYVSHKIPLNYPGGLYYVLQNKNVQNEWNKTIAKQMKTEFHLDEENLKDKEVDTSFKYKDTNKSKFSGILGKA